MGKGHFHGQNEQKSYQKLIIVNVNDLILQCVYISHISHNRNSKSTLKYIVKLKHFLPGVNGISHNLLGGTRTILE